MTSEAKVDDARKNWVKSAAKEITEATREGEVANVDHTEKDGGSFTHIYITNDETNIRIKIGRGSMKDWR